ncbi:MAG: GNAT family N-acetyltransferase [Candidatus Aminicenantaceae bacterium]
MEQIEIKEISSDSDLQRCVFIQKEVWMHIDEDVNPVHQFIVSLHTGGMLLGAYRNKKLIGFVYSFPAIHQGKTVQHSHLLAVLPEYRGEKIGKRLKWAQLDWAVKNGYDLITWTFDPLQALNANLNLHTLGAKTYDYYFNFYGAIPSLMLGKNIPTDRFLIEWRIKEKEVYDRKRGLYEQYDVQAIPKALFRNEHEKNDSLPAEPELSLKDRLILVEIPCRINNFSRSPDFIREWQKNLRKVMEHYISQGYQGEDFIAGKRCFYVLKKS